MEMIRIKCGNYDVSFPSHIEAAAAATAATPFQLAANLLQPSYLTAFFA